MARAFHIRGTVIVILRRKILLIPLALIILAVYVWHWLLHTEAGAKWLWGHAVSASNGALQAHAVKGDLGSGLIVQRLTLSTDATTIEARELRLVADLDLMPLQIQVSNVLIDDARIHISRTDDTTSKDAGRNLSERLSLPLLLVFSDVSASSVTLSGIPGDNDILLTQAALAGSWHDEIVIDHSLVNLLVEPGFVGLPQAVTLQLQAAGTLHELEVEMTSSPLEMSVQGTLSDLLDSFSWDLQGQLTAATLEIGENDSELRITDAHVASKGDLKEYSLSAGAEVDTADLEPFQFAAAGIGSTQSVSFNDVSLLSADVDLSGDAKIAWGDDWSIESKLNVVTFDLSVLLDEWPATHPIRGELSLLLNKDHLAISDSYLAAADTDLSAYVDGKVDLVDSIVAGSLRWENARWPLVGDNPSVSSDSGNISVDGSVDEWRIDGDIEVGTIAMPSGRFQIDGSGDRNHVQATIIDSAVLGGSVSGFGAFSWRDERRWSANLDMSGIGFASLEDDWPEDVSGSVAATGQMLPFLLQLQLSNIDADYYGETLSANGQIDLAEDRFVASELKIRHGDSRFELDGDPFARSGLMFDVAVEDAARYYAAADGTFAAAGRVSLHAEQPSLRINASSPAFSLGQVQLTDIEIIDQSGDDGIINAEMTADKIDIRGNEIDNFKVNILANAAEQSLRLAAAHGSTAVEIFALGKLDDLEHPSSWQGELQELNLALGEGPLVELTAAAAISLTASTATIDHSCIAANTGTRLCVEMDWSADEYVKIAADLADVPAELINGLLDTGLRFDQLLSGNLAWSQDKESGVAGNADVAITAGSIIGIDYPDIEIVTESGTLSFDVIDGQRLSGSAALTMPGLGHVAAQLSIPDLTQGTDSRVDGVLDLALSDMAVLAALSPLIDSASGEIRIDLALSGTLSDPLLVGDLAVTDGTATYLPVGLQLDEVNLTSQLHDDGQMDLTGRFRAGDGYGEIVTRADYAMTGAKGFELELRGNNMTLIDTANVSVRADLDIRVGYDFKNLLLDGQVDIPYARVNPSSFSISGQTESEDVVIVAGELPDDALHRDSGTSARITGSIGVAFGDDVLVDIGPASAKMTGSTVFTWNEELIPIADGRYETTGTIQALGQVLEITEGGLRFPKIPADNPFIRIRAEREIYGNSQVKTAGVLVDGNLHQLTVAPYTRPATTEERALTLLVTGSDFNFEQGLGAIDFGTYIAPRVFVSYGVGLFEVENVIRLRYDLKRGFGITATSGEKETGLDLSYRIER